MHCNQTAQLHAYHDGEVPAEQARDLQAHLQQCPVCREELAALQSLSRQLREATRAEPTAAMINRWRYGIRRADDRRVLHLAGFMTAAAAAILAAASTWLALQPAAAEPTLYDWDMALLYASGEEPAPPTVRLAQWMAEDLAITANGDRTP